MSKEQLKNIYTLTDIIMSDENENYKKWPAEFRGRFSLYIATCSAIFQEQNWNNMQKLLPTLDLEIDENITEYPALYNAESNKIILNDQKDFDIEALIGISIMDIATTNDKNCGLVTENNPSLKAIDRGLKFMHIQKLFGNNTSSKRNIYFDEYILTDLLANIVGIDVLNKAMLTNNPNYVTDELKKLGIDDTLINGFCESANSNLNNRKSNSLALAYISLAEMKASTIKTQDSKTDEDEWDIFVDKIITTPQSFDIPNAYLDLKDIVNENIENIEYKYHLNKNKLGSK